MEWFRYLKSTEEVDLVTTNTNYSYPLTRRQINTITPRDIIKKGDWLSIDIEGMNIGVYYDSSFEKQIDHSSYLVVYSLNQNYEPVKCIVNDDVLYFQSARQHPAGTPIAGTYEIYYSSKNIRYVKPVKNGPPIAQYSNEYEEFILTDFKVFTAETGDYVAPFSEVSEYTRTVNVGDDSTYNFSFVNTETYWEDGLALRTRAKMYFTFSGPLVKLYGSKGPDYGQIKLTLTSLSDARSPVSRQLEPIIIDCYSKEEKENVVLFSRAGNILSYKDYAAEVEVLETKNPKSSGNKFKVNYYKFNHNLYVDIKNEELHESLTLASSGAARR